MNALISLPDNELQHLISSSPDPAVRQAALNMLTRRRTVATEKLPAVRQVQKKPVDDEIAFDWTDF